MAISPITNDDSRPWGHVDIVHPLNGIKGWAVNWAYPAARVKVELLAGEKVLAEADCTEFRKDLHDAFGISGWAGFTFDASVFENLWLHSDVAGDDRLSVRIMGLGAVLPGLERWPSVDEILCELADDRKAAELSEQKQLRNVDHEVEFIEHEKSLLVTLLDDLQEQAAQLLTKKLRPIPENSQGRIEAFCVDPSGVVWIGGWIERGNLLEFAAVVTESGRDVKAAAVMLTCYARDDLPAGAFAFIGLIYSDWRPSSRTFEFSIFFGDEGRLHLAPHLPMQVWRISQFIEHFEWALSRSIRHRRTDALNRVLMSGVSWLPRSAEALGFTFLAGIDRAIVVPAFGCFVEGWLLSPMKHVSRLRLRAGTNLLGCDPVSLYWKSRPDLQDSYPQWKQLTKKAGFVGLFRGNVSIREFLDPVLNVVFADGSAINYPVASSGFTLLGHSAELRNIVDLYPALIAEPFFADFSAAVRRDDSPMDKQYVSLAVRPVDAVLVFVLPPERCDLFLLCEELYHRLIKRNSRLGIALMGESDKNRADVIKWFREFSSFATPVSLFFSIDLSNSLKLLEIILGEIKASRFVFVAETVTLTESGWEAAVEWLDSSKSTLTFFEVLSSAERTVGERCSECFAWSSHLMAQWSRKSRPFLGGYCHDNGLSAGADMVRSKPRAAIRSGRPRNEPLVDAINAVAID